MLCSRFKQILFTNSIIKNNNVQFRCFVNARFVSKRYGFEGFWATLTKHRKELYKMNSVRFIFRGIGLNKLWNAWSRSAVVGHVVRRCRKDKGVREMIHCFRQTILRPRRSLLLCATAACKAKSTEEKPGKPLACSRGISDEDLEILISDLDGVAALSKNTLYCLKCGQRLVIEKKQRGIKYCLCSTPQLPEPDPDGWVPYMEAENVIIWRKEYKPGRGLFAYKVYGRYKEVQAQDYAAVNVDGAYRRLWDSAVAALSVVERNANGLADQAVLHWEVLWPRLFANRDYVYIRRHKEFSVKSDVSPHLFDDAAESPPGLSKKTPPGPDEKTPPGPEKTPPGPEKAAPVNERPSVHDNAKKKSLESYSKEVQPGDKTNKVYVIVSRSCVHPDVPETRNAIRVAEYWSHMVVKTIDGEDEPGMEFVLTYYDEPAVGGMPSGVTAWATGRAAPVYLQRMRLAAKEYMAYKKGRKEDIPDFTPFSPETKKVSFEEGDEIETEVNEEDMESSKTGPEMDYGPSRSQATQTDDPPDEGDEEVKVTDDKVTDRGTNTKHHEDEEIPTRPRKDNCEKTPEITEELEKGTNGGWWRYLYPLYYFV